ncbi:MAG: hypothetical protein GX213_04545 [Clostridiaceae bacterium]|nr:hypothetical protein [Clostridiaceae bacterium]
MPKISDHLDKKVNAYIDNLFSGVGPTQQLYDLKEELATNIKEKIADYIARGMDEEQAYKEAIISMGDLSGLVDDMRKLGQDAARQTVYSTMAARISTAGIVAGSLLILFGIFTALMLYFMSEDNLSVLGNGVFVIAGSALLTYSVLTRETSRKYAMNKIRAGLYALSVGVILFSFFTSAASWFATGEMYVSVASLMVFFLAGFGLLLYLVLTESDRRKI